MRKAQTGRRRFRIGASPWEGMGAGFTDQGFAEHFFALQHKNLYSVSHRTCKLKYVHFNMPPKQPSVSCISTEGGLRRFHFLDMSRLRERWR